MAIAAAHGQALVFRRHGASKQFTFHDCRSHPTKLESPGKDWITRWQCLLAMLFVALMFNHVQKIKRVLARFAPHGSVTQGSGGITRPNGGHRGVCPRSRWASPCITSCPHSVCDAHLVSSIPLALCLDKAIQTKRSSRASGVVLDLSRLEDIAP